MPPQNTSVKVSDHRVESTWISVQVLLGVMLVRIKAAAGVGETSIWERTAPAMPFRT